MPCSAMMQSRFPGAAVATLFLVCASCGVAQVPPAPVAPGGSNFAAVDVSDHRQVFIDGRFLAVSRGVMLAVQRPARSDQPVLVPEDPARTTIGGYASVVWAGGSYHLWYDATTRLDPAPASAAEKAAPPARHYICYARSADGLRWDKPLLNLARAVPHAEPNIIIGSGAGGYADDAPPIGAVVLDPHAPASDRYLLPVIGKDTEEGALHLNLLRSADGIHWRIANERIMTHGGAPHDQLDTQNVIFWDERVGRYVAFIRRSIFFPWGRSRGVGRLESDDPAHFPNAEESAMVLGWDPQDPATTPPGTGEQVRLVDYYTNATVKYPWADDAYFMFPSAYFHYEKGYLPEFPDRAPRNAGVVDIRFAASRDGIAWQRYDRRAFVGLGERDDWNGKALYMARGIVPGTDEREMYLYYRGADSPHGWGIAGPNNALLEAAGLGSRGHLSGIGRLVLRRDGLVAVRAAYAGGEFTTPPLRFAGDELVLNIDTSAGGEARVELLDEWWAPIAGFTLADCDRIHTANAINRLVSWRARSSLASLAGRAVRLHVVLRDTDLFAFQFRRAVPGPPKTNQRQ